MTLDAVNFYHPLTLGTARRKLSKDLERDRPSAQPTYEIWCEGIQRLEVEYEEMPADSILQAIRHYPSSHHFWLVLGEPGAGKTRLLEHWFTKWAGQLNTLQLGMAVPVLFRLRELEAEDLKLEAESLADRLWERGIEEAVSLLGDQAGTVYRVTRHGLFQPVWLLDGLDEVRPDLQGLPLHRKLANLPGLKVVSCRTAVYASLRQQADGYKEPNREYEILGIKPTEMSDFLTGVFAGNSERATDLQRRIQDNVSLRFLAGNPLMLTLIAEVSERIALPATRAAFYQEAVVALWDRKLDPEHDCRYLGDKRDRLLTMLAEEMGIKSLEGRLGRLVQVAREVASDDHKALIGCLGQTGLLSIDKRRERFGYAHLTFQEYYLAQSLLAEGLKSALERHWDQPRYEETLSLLISLLAEQRELQTIEESIQWLLTWGEATHQRDPQILWWKRRSPLRTALHLLWRSALRWEAIPDAEVLLWDRIGRNRLCKLAVTFDKKCPAPLLARLARDPDEDVRRGVVHNPNTPAEILVCLRSDSDFGVRMGVAGNPNTPAETLVRLSSDPDYMVREDVAGNFNTPTETLVHLASDPDDEVRRGVAENPNAPAETAETLVHLVSDPDDEVREGIAENPNTPAETLVHLASDSNDRVRWGVAQNPNILLEDLTALKV